MTYLAQGFYNEHGSGEFVCGCEFFGRVSRFVESEVGEGREVSFLQGRSG